MNLELFTNRQQSREAIDAFEIQLLAQPQLEIEPRHFLIPGKMYARELFMPANSVIMGKIHLNEHFVFIAFGDVVVATDETVVRYTGPQTFIGKPGSKRVLHVLQDTLWTAIHVTDAHTVQECEDTLVAANYSDLALPSFLEA